VGRRPRWHRIIFAPADVLLQLPHPPDSYFLPQSSGVLVDHLQNALDFPVASGVKLVFAYDMGPIEGLLAPTDVTTTVIYTHGLTKGGHGVRSLVDDL